MEHERGWSLEALVADTRATVSHVAEDLTDVRQDIRRLDDRTFHLLLVTLATLATALASLVAVVVS
ncbi:MAG: hypothetical protein E6G64_08935 [Actinobacteria bacterium]|nr:MAG: hypothetical protein E6G64_08935 [Actinomycetota bacterium]